MLKSRTTTQYILLWFITERASGITATSRHIPQLTRSNSSAMMKRYRRLPACCSMCLMLFIPVGNAVQWHCASSITIFNSLSVLTFSQLWTSSACHFRLTAIPHAFRSHLSASNGSWECAFAWGKNLSYGLTTSRWPTSRSSAPLQDATHR